MSIIVQMVIATCAAGYYFKPIRIVSNSIENFQPVAIYATEYQNKHYSFHWRAFYV